MACWPVSNVVVAYMPASKKRTRWLLVVLLLLSGWWGVQHWHGYILWPGQCDGSKPEWFPKLVMLARQHGYPGFQLSLQQSDGQRLNCTAGQAAPGINFKPMQPGHRLRYASLSKVFTSLVSQQMLAEGRLRDNARLLDYVDSEVVPADKRIQDIRIRQLLRHTAGFDRSLSSDPMLQPDPWCPARLQELSRIMLDHTPGSHYAYSNLGYCLLGAVLARLEEKPLQDIFTERLFAPAGVNSIQPAQMGYFATDEAIYHYQPPENQQQLDAMPYASMLAIGGWTGTAADFLQVLSVGLQEILLDDNAKQGLLAIDSTCDPSQWRLCHGNGFYAYQPTKNSPKFYWRDGSLPGVTSFAGIGENGELVTFLANSRRFDWQPDNDELGMLLYRNFISTNRKPRND